MSVKVADTIESMNPLFPAMMGTSINVDINGVEESLQDAIDNGDIAGSSIQTEALPIPTAEYENSILQYTGPSGTYTKGFFYECMNYGYYCWTIDNDRYYTKSTETKVNKNVYIKNGDLYEEVGVIVEIINDTLTFEDDNENEITLGRYSDGDITNVGYEWTSINVEDGSSVVDEVARERAYEAIELAETKLSRVTTMPTDIQYTTTVLYVGETTSKYTKGHIYQCTPYEETYLTTKFPSSSMSFDLDTLEEINFDKSLISEESYDLSGFTCDGNAVNLSRVYIEGNDFSTIVASYSGTSSLKYITSIDWENKTLVLGSSPSYTSHGGFGSSNFMSTYTVFEWVDISPTPTVDQSYSATSTNAQSGVAVASAVSSATEDCVKTSGNQEINGTKTFNSGIVTDSMSSSGEGTHGYIEMHTQTNIGRVQITGDGTSSSAQVSVVGGNNAESYVNMTGDLVKANNKNVVTSVNSTQADNSGNVSVDVGVTSVNGNTGAVTLSIPTITVDGNTATIIY